MSNPWEEFQEEAGPWAEFESSKEKKKTSLTEDLKLGFSNVGNTVDRAWSGLAGGLASLESPEAADAVFKGMEERVKSRSSFANPEGKEQGLSGKIVSTVSSLPAQVLSFPLSPFETGQTMLDNGETLPRALAGTGLDTAGNVVGAVLPAKLGTGLLAKTLSGAGINAAQDTAVRAGIAGVAEQDKTKEELGPSLDSAIVSGIVGGGMGAVSHRASPRQAEAPPTKPVEFDAPWKEFEQLELPLENSVQQIAEVRGAQQGQMDLFGPINEASQQVGMVSPEGIADPLATKQQGDVPFSTGVEDIAARQAEGHPQRDMFVEEAQLQQRSDPVREKAAFEQQELVKQEVARVLTEQKKAQDVEAAYKAREEQKQMSFEQDLADIKGAQLDLKEHVLRNESPRGLPRSQRGAINVEVFEEGFMRAKKLSNGLRMTMKGTGDSAMIVVEKGGREVGKMRLEPEQFVSMDPASDARAGWVHVDPEFRGQNIPEAMYKFAAEQGNDIVASKNQLGPGKKMWQRFEQTGVSQGMRIPRSQRGAINVNEITEGVKKLTGSSPAVAKAAETIKTDKQRSAMADIIPGLEPYRPKWDSPEKVIAAAPEAKDLTPVQKFTASTMKPGIRKVRVSTNNPLVNFVGEATAKVFTAAEDMARKYITNKDAIGPLFNKLSNKELVEIHTALMSADRHQKALSLDQLRKAGFSEQQITFVAKYQEMERVKLDTWNENLLATGQEPVKERPGHIPGTFSGDYKSLVLDAKGNPIGYIGADTKWGYKKAVEAIKAKHPGATITEMKRSRLGGQGPRSDLFSGVGDLLDVLAKNDPRIADIMQAVDEANAKSANELYRANLHGLQKKGIWGNEGNKPWQTDSSQAAKEFFKAYFRHWEEGMLSHMNMPVEAQIKGLLNNPALDNMPRAKEYVNDYIQHMTGRQVGDIGMALNTILDIPAKLTGLGPSVTRESVNQLNKRLGQQTMGWFNFPFLATQYLQILQTAAAEFRHVTKAVGKPAGAEMAAGTAAVKAGLLLTKERLSGTRVEVSPEMREMFDYADSRGLLTFSEFQDVSQITQGKTARKYDKIVDANRRWGEQGTRPLVFFTFVELLKDSKLPKAEVLDTAYNLTQDAMVDYSARERPLMFQKLGVAGQMAGGLQTFMFSYVDQMAKWGKMAAKGDVGPAAVGLTAALTFAGIQGLPFYQEADELVKLMSDKFFDGQKSIGDIALKNLPDWARYGALSSSTGVNMQSRLSAADVLPNSLGEAMTPYAGHLSKMGQAVGDVASNRDLLGAKNLALAFSPSSARGMMENALMTEDGTYMNRKGEREYPRTDFDKSVRNFNLSSLEESKARQSTYDSGQKKKADMDRKTVLAEKIARGFKVNGASFGTSSEFAELRKEYIERKGSPDHIDDIVVKAMMDKKKDAKQRAQGTPGEDLSSIYNYQYYNAD